jgi:hypothetical protein
MNFIEVRSNLTYEVLPIPLVAPVQRKLILPTNVDSAADQEKNLNPLAQVD